MDVQDEIFSGIENSVEPMIEFLSRIVSVPAVGPLSGGKGEMEKALAIEGLIRQFKIGEIIRHDSDDERVPSGKRPNIEVFLKGKSSERRIVLITHMDVVPPGDPDKWDGDPFTLRVEKGRMIGRGVEDNGQAIAAAVFAMKAMTDPGIEPYFDVSLFIVSDEEESNEKGIGHLLEEGLIKDSDLILVPDHGDPEGEIIETVEKTLLWVRVSVKGKQCHASMPHLGNNALRASMLFGNRVDRLLHERFDMEDSSFDHPLSSFEPTRREKGVSGINVIPGEDVLYFDCRLLPFHTVEEVLGEMRGVASEVESETGVSISVEPYLVERTLHPTPADSPIIDMLKEAVEKVTGKRPKTGGIGGGTCAAMIRNAGFRVAVWETIENQAHSPNEYIEVKNLVKDCKVFAALFHGSAPSALTEQ
ncbi:MAG: M20 family metallo-hydrolase [Thermoplasmatota archaeon]